MSNLRHCPGCKRDLPPSLYKRGMDRCLSCVIDGPGEKPDVIKNKLESETVEVKYMKHEEKIKKTIKEQATGLTRKDISRSTGLTVDTLYPLLRKLTDQGEVVMAKEVVDDRLMNVYYPQKSSINSSSSSVEDVDENKNKKMKSYTEENQTPGYDDAVKAETIPHTPNNNNSWGELRNRLIDAAQKSIPTKQPGLIEALYVMMTMEKEIKEAQP